MKSILSIGLICVLFSFVTLARDDGGWSSSGGGETADDKHNPWLIEDFFHRDNPKTWCIQHGGEDNFSLSKIEAKQKIQTSIDLITNQLDKKWPGPNIFSLLGFGSLSFYTTGPIPKELIGKVGDPSAYELLSENYKKNTYKKLATRFLFENNCNDSTDLKFLLGVIEGKEFNYLKDNYSLVRKRKLVAITIRTQYEAGYDFGSSLDTLEGKGFIWIAPDLGVESLLSSKNVHSREPAPNEIWDLDDELINIGSFGSDSKISLDKSAVAPFIPVVLHEIAHAYGIKHKEQERFARPIVYDDMLSHALEVASVDDLMEERALELIVNDGYCMKKTIYNFLKSIGHNENVSPLHTINQKYSIKPSENFDKFRVAYRLPVYPTSLHGEDVSSYYSFPNYLQTNDHHLKDLLSETYAVEIEYGFGKFLLQDDEVSSFVKNSSHNYPSKFKLVKLNNAPIYNKNNPDYKMSLLAEYSISGLSYTSSHVTSIPFEMAFPDFPGSESFEDYYSEAFRTFYSNDISFIFKTEDNVSYSVSLNGRSLSFLNLSSFIRTTIKLRDKLYSLSGHEVESEEFPVPFYLDFLK